VASTARFTIEVITAEYGRGDGEQCLRAGKAHELTGQAVARVGGVGADVGAAPGGGVGGGGSGDGSGGGSGDGSWRCAVGGGRAQRVIEGACGGREVCRLPVGNALFGGGDPCPGVYKFLTVRFRCRVTEVQVGSGSSSSSSSSHGPL
jgi:hypothetical protein